MTRFLGIGECMVELSPAGPGLWRQGFAGDVFNTLWYARAALPADWQVVFHSAVGTDPVSQDMLDFIEAADISCADMPRIPDRRPGLYAIHLKDGERSFSYWRDTSAARLMMRDPEVLWRKVAAAKVVYFSGITLAILAPEDVETLFDGLERHLPDGAILAFDPNIRPALWRDPNWMREAISRAGGMAQVVLPSFDDESATFGDSSPQATIRRYHALGARQVVVKNGGDPTLVSDGDAIARFAVRPAPKVVDTTSAGDSFAGAYLATFATTGSIVDAVVAAQACAARVVGHRGALVPFDLLGEDA